MKMKSIIIDDDLMARKTVERFCGKMPQLEVVATCENATQAYDAILLHAPDLIFLDVEMPDFTGLQLLDKLTVMPHVILTTAKTSYAYEAFSYRVIDYLKKPLDFPRFRAAVEKAWTIHEFLTEKKVVETKNVPILSNEIFIRTEGRFVRLGVNEILYFENIGDYVSVRTTRGNFIIHSTMKNLDERLAHPTFVKVHRSYIVNLAKIVDIEENTLVIDKKVIPISRANKSLLIDRLNVI
jgi:DNA-binding LytR/AlgR family response regulator